MEDLYLQAEERSIDNALSDGNYTRTTTSAGKVSRLLLMPRGKWLSANGEAEESLGNEMWNVNLKNSNLYYERIKRWSEEAIKPLLDEGIIENFEVEITSINLTVASIKWMWLDKATKQPFSLDAPVSWGE